jgi:hypothetical protein
VRLLIAEEACSSIESKRQQLRDQVGKSGKKLTHQKAATISCLRVTQPFD